MSEPIRCGWAEGGDEEYLAYHDLEWGVPLWDDRALFEFLILEGAQAGLSWRTILAKREGYRRAFAEFDPERIARFGARDEERLLADAGIVRNRAKIAATIGNAKAYLELRQAGVSLADYLWGFVDGRPIANRWATMREVPAVTPEAERMSKELKQRGFRFVGPTILYAFMQAVGMVNDHIVPCFRHRDVAALAELPRRAPRSSPSQRSAPAERSPSSKR